MATRAARHPASALLLNDSVCATAAQSADALRAGIRFFQKAGSPTASTIDLNHVAAATHVAVPPASGREHGGGCRVDRRRVHNLEL